ncbi:DEAD/DEAH box helicase [Bacillus subtilis]|uniref:DEAD/DEAH box helicase n=1 Tax=Bacillus subtilis TaxID=1423 RepID=UPI003CEC9C48
MNFERASDFKNFCKVLKTEDRENIIKSAKSQGLAWKENDVFKVNWMRCAMAINKHIKRGNVFKLDISPPNESKPDKDKILTEKKKTKIPTSKTNNLNVLTQKVNSTYRELEDGTIIIGEGYQTRPGKYGNPLGIQGHIRLCYLSARVPWDVGHYIAVENAYEDNKIIREQLSAKFDRNTRLWFVPFSQLLELLKIFKNIEVSKGIAKPIKEVLNRLDIEQIDTRNMKFKKLSNYEYDESLEGNSKIKLHDYQKRGVETLIREQKVILGYAVGLGKTLTAVAGAVELMRMRIAERVLIICPLAVVNSWEDEIKKFNPEAIVEKIRSKDIRKQEKETFERASRADFIVANHEIISKDNVARQLRQLCDDVIVVDEAHKFKNWSSQRTKSFYKHWSSVRYKWMLTATPFPSGKPKETYTMLSHVRPELVGSWLKFSSEFVKTKEIQTRQGSITKPVRLKNVAKLRKLISPFVVIKTQKDKDVMLSLPKERHLTYKLDLTDQQAKLYSKLLQKAIELTSNPKGKFDLLATLTRMEHVAVDPDIALKGNVDLNYLYPKEEWALNTILAHLEDKENKGIVVFCSLKLPLDKLYNGLVSNDVPKSKIGFITGEYKTSNVEEKFNAGKIKVLLCTSAGEEGINLQKGGDTMIHLDTTWLPKTITQREGRLLRQGATAEVVTIYTPVMNGTVEDNKRDTLSKKVDMIERLLGDRSAGSVANNLKSDIRAQFLTTEDIKAILDSDSHY